MAPGGVNVNAPALTSVSSQGGLVLRMLHAMQAFTKEKQEKKRPGAPPPPPAESKPKTAEMQAAIGALALQTEALWAALSQFISKVEDELKAAPSSSPAAAAAAAAAGSSPSTLLPPGASQALPLVESFFVLCSLQDAIPPPLPQDGDLKHAPSSDNLQQLANQLRALSPSPSAAALLSSTSAPSAAGTSAAGTSSAGAAAPLESELRQLPFMRFAEKHRRLLNAYLRRSPALLESSLGPLVRAHKLIEFDNKRAYFRSKVRQSSDDGRCACESGARTQGASIEGFFPFALSTTRASVTNIID